jgi:hypothetical protein
MLVEAVACLLCFTSFEYLRHGPRDMGSPSSQLPARPDLSVSGLLERDSCSRTRRSMPCWIVLSRFGKFHTGKDLVQRNSFIRCLTPAMHQDIWFQVLGLVLFPDLSFVQRKVIACRPTPAMCEEFSAQVLKTCPFPRSLIYSKAVIHRSFLIHPGVSTQTPWFL